MATLDMGFDEAATIIRQEAGFYLLDKYQGGNMTFPRNYGHQVWCGEPLIKGKLRGEFEDLGDAQLFFTALLFKQQSPGK